MYHHSNLGQFAPASRYHDLGGYVPEEGDDLDDFRFAAGWFDDDDDDANADAWEEFVADGVAATADAVADLRDWRDSHRSMPLHLFLLTSRMTYDKLNVETKGVSDV